MTERLGNAQQCVDAILSGDGFAVVPNGFCGRILRGSSDEAFETLTDDPNRRLIMAMGPDGLVRLAAMSGYDMLLEIGYEPDYIARKLEEGNQFKLVVFEAMSDLPATWANVVVQVSAIYPDVEDRLSMVLGQLAVQSFEQIERKAGYSFAEVDKNGPDDPRFMTLDRFVSGPATVERARAFLYHVVHLRELFTGDGWTYTKDGKRGVREYLSLNTRIEDLHGAVVVDLDVQLPTMVELRSRVAKLHDLPDLVYLLNTGSTGDLVKELWLTPGSSATILGAHFCYAQEALQDDMINLGMGDEIGSYCSEATAKLMAEVAWRKARKFANRRGKEDAPVIGLGITSVVCSKENLPEGKIECANIAVMTSRGIHCVFVKLVEADPTASMGERIAHRKRQGELIDLVALNLLLWATNGVNQVRLDPEWLEWMSSEQFVMRDGGDVFIEPKSCN